MQQPERNGDDKPNKNTERNDLQKVRVYMLVRDCTVDDGSSIRDSVPHNATPASKVAWLALPMRQHHLKGPIMARVISLLYTKGSLPVE